MTVMRETEKVCVCVRARACLFVCDTKAVDHAGDFREQAVKEIEIVAKA